MTRLRWLFVWLALVGGLALWTAQTLRREGAVRSDLLSLLPRESQDGAAEAALAHLTQAGGNRAFLLVVDRTLPASTGAAASTAQTLQASNAFTRVLAQIPQPEIKGVLGFYKNSSPLLAPAVPANLTQAFLSRSYGTFSTTGTFRLSDDPFGYSTAWLKAMPWPQANLRWQEGYLTTSVEQGFATLIILELPADAQLYAPQVAAVRAVNQAEAILKREHPNAQLQRLGGVFYAEASQTGARVDTDRIGLGSVVGVVLLMLVIFRSLSMLAAGFLSIATGVVIGTTAVLGVFGEIHLVTIVFGVSLIGEAADYSIQLISAKLSDQEDGRTNWLQRVTPGLTMALGTSLLGYAAMTLVPLPSIRQIAVFALAGLSGAFLTVLLAGPIAANFFRGGHVSAHFERLAERLRQGSAQLGRAALYMAGGLFLLGLALAWRVTSDDDVRSLVFRPDKLVREEASVKHALGAEASSQFILLHPDAGTDEACLQAAEALRPKLNECQQLGLLSHWTSLANLTPSRAQQTRALNTHRAALSRERASLEAAFAEIGFTPPPHFWEPQPDLIKPTDFLALNEGTAFRHLRFLHQNKVLHVITLHGVKDDAKLRTQLAHLANASLIDKTWSISELLGDVRRQGLLWLSVAFLLALGILSLRYGLGRSLVLLLPTAIGVAWAPVLAGACGVPFSVFSLMALMLVLGVGVNYSIFLWEGGARSKSALAGVIASCLTTLLSFGLLSLCTLPALHWLGLTLTFGILTAFLLTPLALALPRRPPTQTSHEG
jgi:predicted exporter